MNRAVEELNYQGTFVHVLEGNAETLRIIHRREDGRSSERIESLDGVGREIIRHGNQVQCILPDRRVVLLEDPKDLSPLVSALPSYSDEIEPHYALELARDRSRRESLRADPRDQAARRVPLRLHAVARSRDRDAAEVAADRRSGRDRRADPVHEHRPAQRRFRLRRSSRRSTRRASRRCGRPSLPSSPRRYRGVPRRCRAASSCRSRQQSQIAGSEYPVEHLVYSDGLATVSVFIEDPHTKSEVSEGFSKMGSTNAFSLTLRGRKVTAVGEVPRQTVRTIASSLVTE